MTDGTDRTAAGAGPRSLLVSHEELEQAVGSDAYAIVDVREPDEYADGHVPGADNLPLSRFDPDLLPADKHVVLICKSGGRSANALQRALAAGLEDIGHYAGGTLGWLGRGGNVER